MATEALGAAPAGRRLVAAVIAAAVLAVGLAVVLVIELTRSPGASAADDTLAVNRSAAVQDAVREAPVLFSYDYRTLDKDLAAARAVTTGSFTSDYDKVSVPNVKPLAAKYKVMVAATVLGASVVDDTKPAQIKVLLFLNQTVRNSQLAAPRVDSSRTVLTMQRAGTVWKVAGVDAL